MIPLECGEFFCRVKLEGEGLTKIKILQGNNQTNDPILVKALAHELNLALRSWDLPFPFQFFAHMFFFFLIFCILGQHNELGSFLGNNNW